MLQSSIAAAAGSPDAIREQVRHMRPGSRVEVKLRNREQLRGNLGSVDERGFELGGGELRSGRGRAWWRNGDGWSVSVDAQRGMCYDHRDGIGGGVLDLVMHVQGGTRGDALRAVADMAGVTLDDGSPNRIAMSESALIRLDSAYFASGARAMAEEALEQLPHNDPEREVHTALLRALAVSPEAEYQYWLKHNPECVAALVYAGRERARRLQLGLARYLMAEVAHEG
jgi:hypothetical protein